MTPRTWLIKSAGRTASHLLLGTVEQAGYELCWTEQHTTDTQRQHRLASSGAQVWYDHQRGWPNPGVEWRCVLIRRRDFRAQVLSKIASQHTRQFVEYSQDHIPPFTVMQSDFDGIARDIVERERQWMTTAPGPVSVIYREDLIADVHGVARGLGFQVEATHTSRFQINPRSLQSLFQNWYPMQTWELPPRETWTGL
jgi:hypothetical protein